MDAAALQSKSTFLQKQKEAVKLLPADKNRGNWVLPLQRSSVAKGELAVVAQTTHPADVSRLDTCTDP